MSRILCIPHREKYLIPSERSIFTTYSIMERFDETYILTVGYGQRPIDEFLDLLRRHRVGFVIDIRSRPYSRYRQEFGRERLAAQLSRTELRYVYMGDVLGGMPEDPDVVDDEGGADYSAILAADWFQAGIARLKTAHEKRLRVALMCGCLRPMKCHRGWLLADALETAGVPFAHIDEDGELMTQEEALDRHTRGQRDLFE